jgi:predicted nucleotidyltransferase
MLNILNTLKPFFEDNYRRINVREFSRIQNISPPTASKQLEEFHKENLLKKEIDKQYIYYYANKESQLFIDLLNIYWKNILEESKFLDFIEKEYVNPIIILFGSLSKAETTEDSDVDIAIFTTTKKEINVTSFEKKLNRKIHILIFKNIDETKNNYLLNNILNGIKLRGNW